MSTTAAVQLSFPSLHRTSGETLSIRYHLLIIENHALIREALARLFRGIPDCAGIFQAGDFEQALEVIRHNPVDIIFLDCDLDRQSAFLFLNRLIDAKPAVRVLLLTHDENSSGVGELLRAGSVGAISRQSSTDDVRRAIRLAMQGKTWRNSRLLRRSDLLNSSPRPSQRSFTHRQRKVLQGILEGHANKEIAADLGVSETSIKCTVRQLFTKTQTNCRTKLVQVFNHRQPS